MHFVKSPDSKEGQKKLQSLLGSSLANGQVLWVVSGGSNIQVVINIMDSLEEELTENLCMLLSDERYGPKAHHDSNYAQLIKAGLKIKQADFPDILAGNLGPHETLTLFIETFKKFKSNSNIVIGQLGIGEDGHIAGVLPGSPGVRSSDSAIYYESGEYKRLTLTLNSLKSFNETAVFCFGENKKPALERLKSGQESPENLPAAVLRDLGNVTVYNDQLEG